MKFIFPWPTDDFLVKKKATISMADQNREEEELITLAQNLLKDADLRQRILRDKKVEITEKIPLRVSLERLESLVNHIKNEDPLLIVDNSPSKIFRYRQELKNKKVPKSAWNTTQSYFQHTHPFMRLTFGDISPILSPPYRETEQFCQKVNCATLEDQIAMTILLLNSLAKAERRDWLGDVHNRDPSKAQQLLRDLIAKDGDLLKTGRAILDGLRKK